MNEHKLEFTIKAMARVLGVSRSGYYAWSAQQTTGATMQFKAELDARVRDVFELHKGRCGAPRIARELRSQGHPYNRKTVARSLRRQGLRARAAKRFKATTNSNHKLPVAPNVLNQDFTTTKPNQKWVSDFTYLETDEGWLYLATVLDLYSRQVVGWAMDKHMKAELDCNALQMALWRRKSPTGVIVHSDRGSQFCSRAYQRLLKNNELNCSMSKRGDCYDNSCAETFFHTLKVELTHGVRYETRDHLKQEVFEYIETYYNTVRRHSGLDYVSPDEYEQQHVA